MQTLFLSKILPLLLSIVPLSLFIIKFAEKFISKNNPKLGDTTTICMNISGVLTEKHLMVRTIYFDKYKAKIKKSSNFVKITEKEDDKGIMVEKSELKKNPSFELMATIGYLCKHDKTQYIEETIKKFMNGSQINEQKIKNEYEKIEKIKSNEEKKISTTVAIKKETKEIFAFSKGNPTKILEKCTRIFLEGKKVEMDHAMRRKIRTYIKRLNKNGQKIIAFAYKPLPFKRLQQYTESFTENDMTFLGLIGVTNPLKTNLKESIEYIKKTGIKLYIATSEKEKKASAIGALQGVINPHYFESITGEYLKNLSDQKLEKILSHKEKDYIFAELKPDDEKRIIKILQNQGETIAIINKNNKKGIKDVVEGIQKSKIIKKNYKKYANHSLTCKIAEFILITTVLILKLPAPLTIGLILILDLTINLILELALRISKSDLNENENKNSLIKLIINGILTGIILSMLFIWNLIRYGWNPGEQIKNTDTAFIKSTTIVFLLLAIIQILKTYNIKEKKNIYTILTMIISVMILYILMEFPIVQDALKLTNLSKIEWQIIGFLTIVILIIHETTKLTFRNKKNEI